MRDFGESIVTSVYSHPSSTTWLVAPLPRTTGSTQWYVPFNWLRIGVRIYAHAYTLMHASTQLAIPKK